jgi:hypothetical protein
MTQRRFVGRALVIVLMGAVINIAVAIACALWSPFSEFAISLAPAHVPGDVQRQVPGLSATRRANDPKPLTFVCRAQSGLGVGAYRVDVNPWFTSYLATDVVGASAETSAVFAAGWPAAVLSSRITDISMDRGWEGGSISMGTALAPSPRLFEIPHSRPPERWRHWQTRPLPISPLWRGLLIGTAFYSLAIVAARWSTARVVAARASWRSTLATPRPRRRLRWAPVVAALLLGAVLNICIATAAALWSPVPSSDVDVFIDPLLGGLAEGWDSPQRAEPPDAKSWTPYIRSRQIGPGVTLLGGLSANTDLFNHRILYVVHTGWPLHSLSARCKISTSAMGGPNAAQLEGAAEAPEWLAPLAMFVDPAISRYVAGPGPALTRPLPLRFHWFGSLTNSIFYGAIILLVARLMIAWLMRSRRRAGACRKCGYTVNTLVICPECGTTSINPRAEAPVRNPG